MLVEGVDKITETVDLKRVKHILSTSSSSLSRQTCRFNSTVFCGWRCWYQTSCHVFFLRFCLFLFAHAVFQMSSWISCTNRQAANKHRLTTASQMFPNLHICSSGLRSGDCEGHSIYIHSLIQFKILQHASALWEGLTIKTWIYPRGHQWFLETWTRQSSVRRSVSDVLVQRSLQRVSLSLHGGVWASLSEFLICLLCLHRSPPPSAVRSWSLKSFYQR